MTRNSGRNFSTPWVLNSSKTSGIESRVFREKSQTFPTFPRSTRSIRMSRSPFEVVIVPTMSSSGLSGSGIEPSGWSLSRFRRGGRRWSRTTTSCRAKSSASSPRRGVLRYRAAIWGFPLCAALRKPSTAALGLLRPRVSLGASGCASETAGLLVDA